MGALAHYIEQAGIATTHVSLVREHSEKIKPPRALWCPFELGRPFGAPNAPEFQKRVLKEILQLLERTDGPILEDFPDSPPDAGEVDTEGWACPVNFGQGQKEVSVDDDPLGALTQEMDRLRSWYDLAVKEQKGRTTVGISEVPLDQLTKYLVGFVNDPEIEQPRSDLPRHQMLKLAVDEHKAYYFESASAQPGKATDVDVANWFYGDTIIGKILLKLNETCNKTDDEVLKMMSNRRIIPTHQQHLKN